MLSENGSHTCEKEFSAKAKIIMLNNKVLSIFARKKKVCVIFIKAKIRVLMQM